MTPELEAEIRNRGADQQAAATALDGLPYAAVPLDQLADIYKRFLRLTRLGQGTIEEWDERGEAETRVRRAVFRQADFGALFAGQWLPKDLREDVRNLVNGKCYNHAFDHHASKYYRRRMDELVT